MFHIPPTMSRLDRWVLNRSGAAITPVELTGTAPSDLVWDVDGRSMSGDELSLHGRTTVRTLRISATASGVFVADQPCVSTTRTSSPAAAASAGGRVRILEPAAFSIPPVERQTSRRNAMAEVSKALNAAADGAR